MIPSTPKPGTDVSLVLTATVAPQPVPALVQTRPEARAVEYATALRRWTRHSSRFSEILWWENSSHHLAHEIASAFETKVTPHVFRAQPFDSHLGKGYGEALMLEQIARGGIGSTYVLKCTGRLSVLNIGSLLPIIHSEPDIVVRLSQDLTYADSRLFLVSSKLAPALLVNLKSDVTDHHGVYLEHALARRVLRLAAQGAKVRFWPTPPRFQGTSASTGERYDSLRSRLQWPAAAVVYRIKRLGTFL